MSPGRLRRRGGNLARVISAIRNCGLDLPMRRITVNLAPADTRKSARLMICRFCFLSLLHPGSFAGFSDTVFIGEVALTGAQAD